MGIISVIEETINGEGYTITKYDSGHIVKELKMTDAQLAIINAPRPPPVDPLANIRADLAEIKADLKLIKNKP